MWKPKHPAFKHFADSIVTYYLEKTNSMSSREAVRATARYFDMSETHVYRYLSYTGTPKPPRKLKRNTKGKFV